MSAPPVTATDILVEALWQAVAQGDEYAAVHLAHRARWASSGPQTA